MNAGHIINVIERWRARNYHPQTRYHLHCTLRTLLRRLARSGMMQDGLADIVPVLPQPGPRTVTVSNADLQIWLDTSPPWLRALLLMCHDCALRVGTAFRVSRKEYDGASIAIRTKRGRSVQVPVSPRLAALLDLAPPGGDAILALLRGGPMHRATVQGIMRRQALKYELPWLRFHDLRRTMAHKAYDVTRDLRVVQQLLGHGELASTLAYLEPKVHELSPITLELALREGRQA